MISVADLVQCSAVQSTLALVLRRLGERVRLGFDEENQVRDGDGRGKRRDARRESGRDGRTTLHMWPACVFKEAKVHLVVISVKYAVRSAPCVVVGNLFWRVFTPVHGWHCTLQVALCLFFILFILLI